jgi:hypothetical protein
LNSLPRRRNRVDCALDRPGLRICVARARFGAGLVGLIAAALAGCASDAVRGVPLYPSDPPRPRSDVALLIGPIETVDGRNVAAHGPLLELLPGCHVVEIGDRVGHVGEPETLAAVSSSRVYAFRMRAGHTYTIEAPRKGATPSPRAPGAVQTIAREENRHGHVAYVPIAMSSYDINACRQWVP